MANPNILPSNRATVAAVINPQSAVGTTLTSGWVAMSTYESLQAILSLGAVSANGLVNAKLQQATSSAGANAKDITGKAIAQLGGTDDNKQAIINLRSEEIDADNDFTHVRLSVSVSDSTSPTEATALVSAVILGHDARYQPATAVTTVAQAVS